MTRRHLGVLVAGALLALGLLALSASPASGHARLTGSDPSDGARLAVAPAQVQLSFDEPVRLPADAVTLVADDGATRVLTAHAVGDGRRLEATVPALPSGAYTVSFRVVSADGHVVTGAIRFGVGVSPSAVGPAATPRSGEGLGVVAGVAQGAVYLGVALSLGTLIAGVLLGSRTQDGRGVRRVRRLGWALLLVGSLVRLALAAPLAAGLGWSGVLQPPDWSAFGLPQAASAIRIGLVVLVAAAWIPRRPPTPSADMVRRSAQVLLAAAVFASVALVGHAATGPRPGVAVAVAGVHLLAMATWLGGLLVVGLEPAPSKRLVRRWSVIAFSAVAALVLSGEYLAWREVQPPDALFRTDYGLTLVIKLALVLGAVALAAVARSQVVAGGGSSVPRLRRLVAAEAVILVGVVGATSVLVELPTAQETYGPAVTLSAPLPHAAAQISIPSTAAGPQTFAVTLRSSGGTTITATSISGRLVSDTGTRLPTSFTHGPGSTWTGRAVVPLPGTWTLVLTVDLAPADHRPADQPASTVVTQASYRVW